MDDSASELHAAWVEFCRSLESLGDIMVRDATPRNEIDQAEGYRFLCRFVRSGLSALDERGGPRVRFREKVPYMHIGFTNPDQDPLTCAIDPSRDYRITGTRGTNAGLGILSMDPATMQHTGWLNHDDLTLDRDGRFEIIVSQTRPAQGDWLELTDRTSMLVIRCNFNDRATEERAQFSIEEIGAEGTDVVAGPLTAGEVIRSLRGTIRSATVMSGRMVEWAEELVEFPNEIIVLDSYTRSGGSPDHDFRFGYFELGDDEALEVSFVAPECDNWQFQVGNWWVENLDNYPRGEGWLNRPRAHVADDGTVTILMSPERIDVPNWVDSFGRRTGIAGLRFVGATSHPEVTTRVVKRAVMS